MADLLPDAPREYRFTVRELIIGLQRELQFRHRVYDRRIEQRTMTRAQADREIALVHALIATAQTLPLDKVFSVPAP